MQLVPILSFRWRLMISLVIATPTLASSGMSGMPYKAKLKANMHQEQHVGFNLFVYACLCLVSLVLIGFVRI